MITGLVNDNLEATVRLVVAGPDGQTNQITAVIDTGYNGALSLPFGIVSVLSLPQSASREVTLGDASRRFFDYYNSEVVWDGHPHRVRVLCVEGDPLIGTGLLAGYKMDADFVPGGLVLLTPITYATAL